MDRHNHEFGGWDYDPFFYGSSWGCRYRCFDYSYYGRCRHLRGYNGFYAGFGYGGFNYYNYGYNPYNGFYDPWFSYGSPYACYNGWNNPWYNYNSFNNGFYNGFNNGFYQGYYNGYNNGIGAGSWNSSGGDNSSNNQNHHYGHRGSVSSNSSNTTNYPETVKAPETGAGTVLSGQPNKDFAGTTSSSSLANGFKPVEKTASKDQKVSPFKPVSSSGFADQMVLNEVSSTTSNRSAINPSTEQIRQNPVNVSSNNDFARQVEEKTVNVIAQPASNPYAVSRLNSDRSAGSSRSNNANRKYSATQTENKCVLERK